MAAITLDGAVVSAAITAGQAKLSHQLRASGVDTSTTLITKGSHDGWWSTAALDFTAGYGRLGNLTTTPVNSFLKFADIAIPKDATVLSAVLTLVAFDTKSTAGVSLLISGNLDPFAVAPATKEAAAALVLTSAKVAWAPTAWTAGVAYTAPDLTAIVQEIVGQATWVPGNPILLLIKDNGGTDGALRHLSTWDNRATYTVPTLTVTYATAADSWVGLPAVSGDDYQWTSAAFTANGSSVAFGKTSTTAASVTHAGVRYPNCLIPKGATILSAYWQGAPYNTLSGTTVNLLVYGNTAAPAVAPTSIAEAEALTLTAGVAWVPGTFTSAVEDSNALSPDLTAVVQALVNQVGYAPGQAIQLVIRDNGSSNTAYRIFSAMDGGVTVSWPSLTVTWDSGYDPDTTTVSGAVQLSRRISGATLDVTNTAGALKLGHLLNGTVLSASTINASLKLLHQLIGAVTGTATVTGSLDLHLIHLLRGAATSNTAAAGALALLHQLWGNPTLTSQIAARLTVYGNIGSATIVETLQGLATIVETGPN